MRKLTTITFLLIGLIGFSQEETTEPTEEKRWFVKTGIMMSSVNSYQSFGNTNLNDESSFSPYIGIGGRFGNRLMFQPELLITHYKTYISGFYSESSNSYFNSEVIRYDGGVTKISIPLIVKYQITDPISIYTGCNVSGLLINKDKGIMQTSSSFNGNSSDDTKKFDRGFSWNPAVILGFEYKLNSNLSFEARYNYTPNFIYDTSDDSNIFISSNIGIREKGSFLIGANYNIL